MVFRASARARRGLSRVRARARRARARRTPRRQKKCFLLSARVELAIFPLRRGRLNHWAMKAAADRRKTDDRTSASYAPVYGRARGKLSINLQPSDPASRDRAELRVLSIARAATIERIDRRRADERRAAERRDVDRASTRDRASGAPVDGLETIEDAHRRARRASNANSSTARRAYC